MLNYHRKWIFILQNKHTKKRRIIIEEKHPLSKLAIDSGKIDVMKHYSIYLLGISARKS